MTHARQLLRKSSPYIAPKVVRCLGPGKEHTLTSWNTRANRICEKCRLQSMLLGAIAKPVKGTNG